MLEIIWAKIKEIIRFTFSFSNTRINSPTTKTKEVIIQKNVGGNATINKK